MSENKKRRVIWRILAAVVFFVLCITVFLVSYLLGIEEWKQFDPKDIYQNMERSLVLLDESGAEYACISLNQKRRYVSFDEIPQHVKDAFIAIEDARFYSHGGVDLVRIGGALIEDIKSGGIVQGASTISQQLVKVSTLTYNQTVSRKLAEIMMAFKLEREYSKDEILELYLNSVYFGNGAYGIEQAARAYFNCSASQLTLAQGATLAGIIKAPSNYAPHVNPENSQKRRNLVLEQMLTAGFISEDELNAAKAEKLTVAQNSQSAYPYGYFTDTVIKQACEILGISKEELLKKGYTIHTTLDIDLQSSLEALYQRSELFPENASDGTLVQSASVVLDAQNSQIRALVGGREHESRFSFNRATEARRQPGSSIKPVLVYAPAVEYCDYSASSFILDEPVTINGYSPSNAGNKYRGWVTLRTAVANSINVPAVKLLNEVGISRAKNYASKVGIQFDEKDNYLSLALGGFTRGVTPLELGASYMPFASGGYYKTPSCITQIYDKDGNTVYEENSDRYAVLSSETSYIMSSMLSSCVSEGTAKKLKLDNIPISAKTGTSSYNNSSNRDAWVVAYNRDYIMTCWMGFDSTDDNHSMSGDVTGGSYPVALAAQMFSKIYEQKTAPEFSMPSGVFSAQIDKKMLETYHKAVLASSGTGETDRLTEYFTDKTLPNSTAEYKEIKAPKVTAKLSGNATLISFEADPEMTYKILRDGMEIATIKGESAVKYTDETPGTSYEIRVSPPAGVMSMSGEDVSVVVTLS